MNDATSRVVSALRAERSPLQLLLVAVGVFLIFSAAAPDVFPSVLNLQSMAVQLPETGLLGLGVMLSMVTAGIDLSVIAIANLSAITMAEYFRTAGAGAGGGGGWNITLIGILIALLVGAGCGLLNGIIIGKLKVTPILATLATFNLFGGLALAWTGGHSLLKLPQPLLDLGLATPVGVPVPFLIFIGCALLTALALNWSRFGLRMTLVGANPTAARFSGVQEFQVLLGTYLGSGLLAGVAGVIIVSRTASATPNYGASYVLLSVVIAVLAGTDPKGGFGTVAGVMLAAVVLQMVQTGFNILHFNQFLYDAVQGAILIGVLALNTVVRGDRLGRGKMAGMIRHRLSPAAPRPAERSETQPFRDTR